MAKRKTRSKASRPVKKRAAPRPLSRAKALRAPKAQSPAALRAIEAALAGIAHDIRTPLTGIVALAELLSASDLGPELWSKVGDGVDQEGGISWG